MTIKDFYKVHKDNDTIEISYYGNVHLFNPTFYTWGELIEKVDMNTKIKKINLNFSYNDNDFLGFIFFVDENDYNKIYKAYKKEKN